MSLIHRVIILNQPTKLSLMGSPRFTPFQWILLGLSVFIAFFAFTQVPREWKIGNLPTGFLVALGIFMLAMVYVKATELKPPQWWTNFFLYRLNMVPKVYYPHIEEMNIPYPDPDIADEPEREEEGYIEIEVARGDTRNS